MAEERKVEDLNWNSSLSSEDFSTYFKKYIMNTPILDDPFLVDPKKDALTLKIQRILDLPTSFYLNFEIRVIDGDFPPKVASYANEDPYYGFHSKYFAFSHVEVGSEWIKQNATDEELAEFIAARMAK